MNRYWRIPKRLFFLIGVLFFVYQGSFPTEKLDIQRKIEDLRIKYGIPAVAYAVANNDRVLVQNVLGYRNNRTEEKVRLNDKFHIGSLGKAVTALVAAKLVEEGALTWDTKFFEVFPEIQESTHPGYKNITLKDLLSHRARLISFQGGEQWKIIADFEKSMKADASHDRDKAMIEFARYLLTLEPIVLRKDESIRYSNVGYQLAGMMIERVSKKKWEAWIEELNRDLNIEFYLGWPIAHSRGQPLGHMIPSEQGFDGDEHIPIPDDIQEFLAPHLFYTSFAGHISISLPDYVKFVQLHLEGLKGKDNYLKAKTYRFLLGGLPVYALGWANDLYQGKHLYHHVGGFVSFRGHVKLVEENDLAIIVFMNTGTQESLEGLHKIRFLLQDYFLQ